MKHCIAKINMSSVRWSFCFILRALENPKEADCPHPDSGNNGVVVRYLEWGVHWKRIVGGCTFAHLQKRIVTCKLYIHSKAEQLKGEEL